jgi:ribosomal-protein-serine acetyltransferase
MSIGAFPIEAPFEIKGKNVNLLTYALGAAPEVFEAGFESREHIYPWMPWCHPAYKLSDSEAWVKFATESWQLGKEFNFTIRCATSNRFLGGCGLKKLRA